MSFYFLCLLTRCQTYAILYYVTRSQTINCVENFCMKKNLGSQLALYPMPVTVIGVMSGEKPTWTLVALVGVIRHNRVSVSLASAHFINQFIKAGKKLSINLVDEAMLPKADYAGSICGAKVDKSTLFGYELGGSGTPVIRESPLTLECSVADVYETPGFESFICAIDNTYVDEAYLNAAGKIDYNTLKPVLFEFQNYEYLRTGDVLGKCLSFKKNPNE